eukprot:1031838-Prymnesium_polylepis.1
MALAVGEQLTINGEAAHVIQNLDGSVQLQLKEKKVWRSCLELEQAAVRGGCVSSGGARAACASSPVGLGQAEVVRRVPTSSGGAPPCASSPVALRQSEPNSPTERMRVLRVHDSVAPGAAAAPREQLVRAHEEPCSQQTGPDAAQAAMLRQAHRKISNLQQQVAELTAALADSEASAAIQTVEVKEAVKQWARAEKIK